MNKKKVFRLGTCVSDDVCYHFHTMFKEFGYTIVKDLYTRTISPSFSTMGDRTGPIASRLHDEMHKIYLKAMEADPKNNTWQTNQTATWHQYNNIVKLNSVQELFDDGIEFKNIHKEDIIIIDFHAEINAIYDDGLDSFMIYPYWQLHEHHFPKWLTKIVNDHQNFQEGLLSQDQIARKVENALVILELLQQKFNNNVVVINNVYTNKLFKGGHQEKFQILKPFVEFDELDREGRVNLPVLNQVYDAFYQATKLKFPDWNYISINNNLCYADPNHRFGINAAHLHSISWNFFKPQIKSILEKLNPTSSFIQVY